MGLIQEENMAQVKLSMFFYWALSVSRNICTCNILASSSSCSSCSCRAREASSMDVVLSLSQPWPRATMFELLEFLECTDWIGSGSVDISALMTADLGTAVSLDVLECPILPGSGRAGNCFKVKKKKHHFRLNCLKLAQNLEIFLKQQQHFCVLLD